MSTETNTIKRVPRPQGTTIQCKMAFHTQSQSPTYNLTTIRRNLLNQYFINNQTINGRYMTIDEVAYYLGMSGLEVVRTMNKVVGYMAGISENTGLEDLKGVIRAISFGLVKNALNGTQLAQRQALNLYNLQGGRYVPYLTGEANRAIANLSGADSNQRETLKLLAQLVHAADQGYQPFLTQSQNGRGTDPMPNHNAQSELLTPDKAVLLLEAKDLPSLLSADEVQEALYLEANLAKMPEVRANHQTSKATDYVPVHDTTATPVDGHEDRREKGYIDTDKIN
jgi:hypothetical protein